MIMIDQFIYVLLLLLVQSEKRGTSSRYQSARKDTSTVFLLLLLQFNDVSSYCFQKLILSSALSTVVLVVRSYYSTVLHPGKL